MTTEQQRILIDVVSVIYRNVPEDIMREDIYTELLSVFEDEVILEAALGEDEVYDAVFKEFANEELEEE